VPAAASRASCPFAACVSDILRASRAPVNRGIGGFYVWGSLRALPGGSPYAGCSSMSGGRDAAPHGERSNILIRRDLS
jgi:hypothetical protein